jgi:D-serine deaminase-like pyridoxal phosphate-dependent protein
MNITKPTLIIDKVKTFSNITRMAEKVSRSPGNINFRPHFKTHQSAEVGEWFSELGVTSIAVSSVDMAQYFASHGWQDIAIALLVNPRQIDSIIQLARSVKLSLLLDTVETAQLLQNRMNQAGTSIGIWIKIDTGYHRTGLDWSNNNKILEVAQTISASPCLQYQGLLTHAGHSYHVHSREELKQIYDDTVDKLNGIRDFLTDNGITGTKLSFGDTPTCSIVDEFRGIDEVRPGNFAYYDVMQLYLGACRSEDISVAVACPVIGRYQDRNEIVIYGGAVHLSHDSVNCELSDQCFGLVALPIDEGNTWGTVVPDTYVTSVSQEHGIIHTSRDFFNRVKVGDLLMILPIHSCLTANLLKNNR